MKVLAKMVLVLGLIAALSGFFLAYVNQKTYIRIKENQEKEIARAVFKLIPEGKDYKTSVIQGYRVYFVNDESKHFRGACILTSGSGYQGEIKILVGLSYNFKSIKGIEILENVETPGLGGEISRKSFSSQFERKSVSIPIKCVKGEKKNSNDIQAITGATISSDSVTRIVNRTLKKLVPLIKEYAKQ
ncbi:MAG: FMN-binding protein [Candidatus Saelkia tenebricola]|nr:FMN-binding protein [Candidatus Saelkia tenebricola]